jgi:site-specific recombinase
MQYVLRRLDDDPAARKRVVALLAACVDDLHLSSLLADHGFAARAALLSEQPPLARQSRHP